jgi:hypothetical protein
MTTETPLESFLTTLLFRKEEKKRVQIVADNARISIPKDALSCSSNHTADTSLCTPPNNNIMVMSPPIRKRACRWETGSPSSFASPSPPVHRVLELSRKGSSKSSNRESETMRLPILFERKRTIPTPVLKSSRPTAAASSSRHVIDHSSFNRMSLKAYRNSAESMALLLALSSSDEEYNEEEESAKTLQLLKQTVIRKRPQG